MWIVRAGHAEIRGNEQADRLASRADNISDLGRAEVLPGFGKVEKAEHHRTDRPKEREAEKGRAVERFVSIHTKTGTVQRVA